MTDAGMRAGGSQELRLQSAAYWVTRHEAGGELTAAELRDWEGWIADTDNSVEYDQVVRAQWQLRAVPRPPLPSDEELQAEEDWPAANSDVNLLRQAGIVWPRRRVALKVTLVAMAAGIAALFTIVLIRYQLQPGSFALDPGHEYTTAAGEQRDFVLRDGSVVTLAGASSLKVSFSATRRTAVLNQGEARFRVQHDRWRPFTVLAGLGSITAVGTVFDVRRYSDRVFVTVSEGAVEVAPQEPEAQDIPVDHATSSPGTQWIPLRVANGEEMTYDAKGDASAARPSDSQLMPSWTTGSLVYRGRPLREVIEDVQRYSTRHIELDPAAGNLQYTGTFVERDLDQWLRGLVKIFPVEIVDSESGRIFIRTRLPPQQNAAIDARH